MRPCRGFDGNVASHREHGAGNQSAIQNLPPAERAKLVADLPALFPELDGDVAWERIIRDSRPRPAFSALLDQVEREYRADATAFPETSDTEFDRHS